MITVERFGLDVKIKGHAGSAEYGKDLVCASASILFYTLVENLTRMEKVGMCKLTVKALEGDAGVHVIASPGKEEDIFTVIQTIMIGYEILEADYPEYVKVIHG